MPLLERINRFLLAATVIWVLVMTAIVAINVIGRQFFRSPLPSTVELVGLLGALLISFGLAPSQYAGRNISIPIVTDTLPQKTRKVFDVSTLVLSLAIIAVLAWTGGIQAWDMWLKHERTSILEWPVAPFRLVWALGCGMLFVVVAANLVQTLRKKGQ